MTEDCLKLTTYSGERQRVGGVLVADALLDLYGAHALQTSILLRGVEGYGPKRRLHSDRLLSLSEDLPVVSVAVDARPRILQLLDELLGLGRHGLVTLERARLLSGAPGAGDTLSDTPGDQTKLTVYVGRQQRLGGQPAFVAICELLAARGIAGATVLLGVDGTVRGERRRARFLATNTAVPMMIIAVGASARIGAVLGELAEGLERPVVTLEGIRVCKRDGQLLARPPVVAAQDESGLPVWQKLMIYSSEQARHGASPLHVSLVRELAAHGVRGATCLRGMWGFHGDHAPHGDRLLSVRRRVPVVTVVVDAPERIAAAFDVVDAHTTRTGLVTSELVPTAVELDDGRAHGELRLARPGS